MPLFLTLIAYAYSNLPDQFEVIRQFDLNMPDPLLFGRCDLLNGDPIVFSKDAVYLVDESINRVLIFGMNGTYMYHFGKTGNGPDEIAKISRISVSPTYCVLTDRLHSNQYLVYTDYGDFLRKVTIPSGVGSGGLIESNCPALIIGDAQIVTPFNFRSSFSGEHRIVVRDILTGKAVAQLGDAVKPLSKTIGFLAPVSNGTDFWVRVPYTRTFARYSAIDLKKIDQKTFPYTLRDPTFDVDTFNRMVRTGKGALESVTYYIDECYQPRRYFAMADRFVTYEQFLSRPTTLSVYDIESQEPLTRIVYNWGAPDSIGIPVHATDTHLYFFKTSDEDPIAGTVSIVSIRD